MTYKSPMEEMLEAFGARAKYDALKTMEMGKNDQFRAYSKAHSEYFKDLVEFATEWDKAHPPKPNQWNSTPLTCRDKIMRIKGAQDALTEYHGIGGMWDLNRMKEQVRSDSEENCLFYTIKVYA